MAKFITVHGKRVLLFDLDGQMLLESYEIARVLGYKQQSSLRKQVLKDWTSRFQETWDYVLYRVDPTNLLSREHPEQTHLPMHVLEKYETQYEEMTGKKPPAVKPERGRLFFTPKGIQLVLLHSSKPGRAELRDQLVNAGFLNNSASLSKADQVLDPETNAKPILVPLKVSSKSEKPEISKLDRMFQYEVLQTLIGQLERNTDPALRGLAVSAAELALGRPLDELRKMREPTKRSSSTTTPRLSTEGPLFTVEGYYSMTRIGEKAGGYDARTTGLAVNVIAARRGYSKEQVREQVFSFNQIEMRPDNTTGKERRMVRFNKEFANEVIKELRANPQLHPIKRDGAVAPFGAPGFPKLNRSILDD